MGSSYGASAGADMLQQILREKAIEIYRNRELNQRAQEAAAQNQIAQGHLRLGEQGLAQNASQFAAQEPVRLANVRHIGAETESLNRAPAEAEKGRTFAQSQAQAQQTFAGGQGDLNRQNAVRIAGINGVNALRVAQNNHPQAGQTPQQQNEVADSLALIDQISNDPALNTAVGPVDQYIGKARDLTGVNRFEALHNQLVGKLSLAQAGKLKGQGQISDKERQLLKDASTALSRGLGEGDYRNELGKIRGQFQRMLDPNKAPANGTEIPVNVNNDATARALDLLKKYGG